MGDYQLFFFNDTATTEIYTLSLHDALPISRFRVLRFTFYVLRITYHISNPSISNAIARIGDASSPFTGSGMPMKKKRSLGILSRLHRHSTTGTSFPALKKRWWLG